MKVYKCDRCGKTCDACYIPTIKVNNRTYYVVFNQSRSRVTDYPLDLCDECSKSLESWWMGGCKK